MIIHIIANVWTPTRKSYTYLAHSMMPINFCNLFKKRGHTVYFYGDESSEVNADKIITIINSNEYDEVCAMSNDFRDPLYMTLCDKNPYHDIKNRLSSLGNERLQNKLISNYQKGDIIIHTLDHLDPIDGMIHVEYSMGGFIRRHNCVYITNDYLISHYDSSRVINKKAILPWYNSDEFEWCGIERREDTVLYMARCIKIKGIEFYIHLSTLFHDIKFLIAGGVQSYDPITKVFKTDTTTYDLNRYPNVSYLGTVDHKERTKLLLSVSALLQPTFYREPCGLNVIEAMLCGTPCIVPGRGGFVDTVEHGVSGYLCECDEWPMYIKQRDKLNNQVIKEYAINKFSEERAYHEFIDFFNELIEQK